MIFWLYWVKNKTWWLYVHTWADTQELPHPFLTESSSLQDALISHFTHHHFRVCCLRLGAPELSASSYLGGEARKPWEGGGDLGQGNDELMEGFAIKQAPWGHLGFSAAGSARNAGARGTSSQGSPLRSRELGCLPSAPITEGGCSQPCQSPSLSGLQHGGQLDSHERNGKGQGDMMGIPMAFATVLCTSNSSWDWGPRG